MQLRLPDPHKEGLNALAMLPPETADKLLRVFQDLGTVRGADTQTPRPMLTRHDVISAASSAGVPLDDAEAAIDTLLALHVFRTNQGWSNEQLARAAVESPDAGLQAVDKEVFVAILLRFLAVGAIAILSKAFDVVSDYEHVFGGARILTDSRPVFGDDPRTGQLGMIIVQNLKIDYVHRDGSSGSFYVAMDDANLHELKEKVDRATVKAEVVQQSLAESGVPYIVPDQSDRPEVP